jgi:hypothetical protein
MKQADIGVRSEKFSVGKTMGNNTWVHRLYEDKLPRKILLSAKKYLPIDFNYTVVKYNSKTNDISFIESPDFDVSDEPTVGESLKITPSGSTRFTRRNKNPAIYHHKWLMVRDDYPGFDVKKSVERSIRWKTLVGVNKKVSNRIGRHDYWSKEILPKLHRNDFERSGKTATTRKAVSRPTRALADAKCIKGKVLHHGCGKAKKDSALLKKLSDEYSEYDANYAPDRSVLDATYDTVISNYVLNTLPAKARRSVWLDIARCVRGAAYIAVRRDKIKGTPLHDGFITAKNTFQRKFEPKEILKEASIYFSKVKIFKKFSGGLLIEASEPRM